MTLQQRIDALSQLGDHLQGDDEFLDALVQRTAFNNPWFTVNNQQQAVQAIATQFLQKDKLKEWLAAYEVSEKVKPKTVGLVLAGNIPLVGFHDVLCVFVAGHRAKIKLSEKDKFLLPYLVQLLEKFQPGAGHYFDFVERLNDFDAVIATGSNNSARYFEAYFGKYPHIIRRNRNGVAVLDGSETKEDLHKLGRDIFSYFGLGCRNVAKLYVPQSYDFVPLLEALHEFRDIVLHNKYKNNFDYYFAMHVLNKVEYMNNGCIMLSENPSLQSPIANLHYEHYTDLSGLRQELEQRSSEIQVVVSKKDFANSLPFGKAQEPELADYADGVDTMAFLLEL